MRTGEIELCGDEVARHSRAPGAQAHAGLLASVRRSDTPRGAHDLIIAATAVATGRTVVTADRAAFDTLPGVELRFHR